LVYFFLDTNPGLCRLDAASTEAAPKWLVHTRRVRAL
jgi:hypothetical protein